MLAALAWRRPVSPIRWGASVPQFRGRVSVWWCGVSVLLGGVQQGEGVAEALVEDLVGELPVG